MQVEVDRSGVNPMSPNWISRVRFVASLALGLALGSALVLLPIAQVARAESGKAEGASGRAAPRTSANSMIEEQLARIPSGEEGVRQLLDPMRSRLDLTPEQERTIRPLIEAGVAELEKTRDRFKAGEITPMALMTQLMASGQKTATRIEPHLSEKQVSEYRAMRQEQRRQAMQEMMKRGRQAAP